MGKPKKLSNLSDHRMATPIGKKSKEKIRRANQRRLKHNISKVFETLRNQSNTTVQSVDTVDGSFIAVDDSPGPSTKKRLSTASAGRISKRSRHNPAERSLIVIQDDCVTGNLNNNNSKQMPKKAFQCSTPKDKKNNNTALRDLMVSNIPQTNFNEEVNDLTKEINRDSYVTIDLTADTLNGSSKTENTVIDLANTTDNDCTIVNVCNSNTSLSMSGDSEVTILKMPLKKNKQMHKVFEGISHLNSEEKGTMLEFFFTQILNGCNVPDRVKAKLNIQQANTMSPEDQYINSIMNADAQSRNSVGSNLYRPDRHVKSNSGLRLIVIDGSNVAMEHGRGRFFSVKGLQICIEYFVMRGHVVKAFVPRFRCKFGKSSEPRRLDALERSGRVVYTPSREIQGRLVTSYDDRYIVQCAAEFDGVIVSGDNYRDLLRENPRWRFVIENRLLQFTWVDDMIMFPKDPLGRTGPSLGQFLRHPGPSSAPKR